MPNAAALDTDGKLTDNIVHFTRALRKAGVVTGTAQLQTCIQALATAGFSHKADFYHVLQCTLISRADDLPVFHQLFSLFWRNPEFLQQVVLGSEQAIEDNAEAAPPAQRRATDALDHQSPDPHAPEREKLIRDATFTRSEQQVDRQKDFEQMSTAELHEAEQVIKTLTLPAPLLKGRRSHPSPNGARFDLRSTLRTALRNGGELQRIERKGYPHRPMDLVVICDISGSMSVYSRMIMRFLHALSHTPDKQWSRIHTFTFGTRLTNVTRALYNRDPDTALSSIGREASDWEGGTLIGTTIKQFNKDWTRRVMSRGAVVLFISDGLERGDPALLRKEMARLQRFSRTLIWLNPLLRWDGFKPAASGIKAILPHVDSFHACHSLDRLADLSRILGERSTRDHFLQLSAKTQ